MLQVFVLSNAFTMLLDTFESRNMLIKHLFNFRMAEEQPQGRRRAKKKELDHDMTTFGYWYVLSLTMKCSIQISLTPK